ncbi:ARFGEF family member 3 [Phyllostomus discolor]|uniref:ARFGEF family member 3 n=1 Tax=Phyllostomus discolor TaxID=89673 RepID=A0A834E9J5_9CHIR|nr:ARFGEF family member 3 [Phyllostomus discolor]
MEEILRKLQKEASGSKYKAIKESCTWALETLGGVDTIVKIPPHLLREKCLLPLQLALESKNMKLAQHALAGIQKLLSEERFVSMETDSDEKQLLNQVLNAVKVTPSLNEDLQVEVMKVLLCITYTPTFDLNGSAVLKIAEVCIETYTCSCHQRSINTAVRATLSQMLSDLTLQLRQRQENTIIENPDVPQEFRNPGSTVEALCDDLVSVLTVLCEKLQAAINDNQQLQLLYLECILSVLSSSSSCMHLHRGFTDLIWKNLCPALIVILGNPIHDKTITSAHSSASASVDSDSTSPGVSDHGRGSGCSSTAPALSGPVARTIYYIAAELVRLVGSVDSMKPVLQSLYHRMLLYPPPQHRVEAIKVMKELLGSPQRLCDLAGPSSTEPETRKRSISKRKSHLDLLKLIMDGMTEACIKGGIEACYASVSCVCTLLGALDELSQGKGLSEGQVQLLLLRLEELKDGAESSRDSMEINEADFRWQRRVLSSEHTPWESGNERSPDISISVTTDTGQTTLEGELGQTTPEDHCENPKNSLKSPAIQESKETLSKATEPEAVDQPDVVQRSHTVAYPDITNFLSVDCRMRSYGSRYSESNFSVDDQDLSRTEFDSCDQYSMAAEKDSGRSDVSDIGSDNCSLADEEQTPRDCLGHRSLRTAALSLKLLKNQEADQHSARLFVQSLESLLPRLLALPSVEEVDAALQSFASTFCSGMMHSPGFDGNGSLSLQMLMNADSLYAAAHCALLLNLKLSHGDYYRKRPALAPGMLKEFMKQVHNSGVVMVFSQAWIEELYHQVLDRNMLGEAGYWGSPEDNSLPLITMLTDIDGLESSAIGGQLMASASTESPFTQGRRIDDSTVAGVAFARYILVGCWKNLIDTLSTPLTGRMAGSSKGLAFILGAEGIKEQNQKERDAICMSLDGLRKAARLSCALGVAANCASALAQMAAASCVQEEKEDKEVQEPSDTIAQVKLKVEQKLEQIGKLHGVSLHTAHVLCMDAILSVGLEMGSHNPDCWPHVFRVCEYVGTLEHTHFSDGTSQPALTISQPQKAPGGPGLLGDLEGEGSPLEQSPEQESSLSMAPVIQPLSIQELIREGGRGRACDFRGGSLMTGSSAAKAVLTLSTQADRLFEDATDKLNLMALGGFLYQLKKASQSQLFHSVTDTVDYSLAMPGEVKSTQDRKSALHLFRLGDAMLRIVRSRSRPLLHVMRCWSLVAPHLVEAACHKERHVSQKAVSFIHDILTEVLTDWNEPPHFHFNEALFRPFERIMQLELCDEDVQDQVVTSIGELVEVCSSQIQSGWRPLFSALETVHSGDKSEVKDYLVGDYSMGKGQAPVFDVFEAFLNTDNIQVFANAATSYIMCLMKFVKGPSPGEEKAVQVPEAKLAGFLRYISMQNLAVIFDLLLDSYRTAREFDTSPGLKCLLKKVSGIGGAANLYRQSAMSFNIYFHALVCAVLTNQETITAEQVKKILFEDDERSTDSSQQCSSEDEDIFEETAQVSPPRGKEKRQWRARMPSLSVQPISNADWVWLVKRLHKLCMELCNNYIQMHLDLENSMEEAPVFKSDPFFILPSFQSESSTPSTGGFSGKDTPSEDDRSQTRDHLGESLSLRVGSGETLMLPPSPKVEKKDPGRKKEWWENAGNKIYTMAADKTISKLMTEYKKRKQQHNLPTFPKEVKVEKKGEPLGPRGQGSPLLQRPQHLMDQGQMRHSFSAGPELLQQEKRPRSGSTGSSLSVSVRDAEAQIQAWTNMVLTVLNQIQILPDPTFTALQPAVFPCISQLTCHVTDIRVRQAVREWLGRVGRVYDIIV